MKFTLNNQANVNTLFVGDPHDTQDGTNFAKGGGVIYFLEILKASRLKFTST